ncbi:MAG TPA: DUF1003 domain-containing protein [Haliangiales bacterium]|nr:DUF1003 domain-containing protein [Haliangiales bacterium]
MDRKKLLANIPLFESLAPEDLSALEARLEERQFPADAVVFSQGDPGDTLFVIQEGSVEVAFEQGKRKLVLANLFEGQYVGEISLLDGGARSATVRTLKPTLLLALDRHDFTEFLTSKPRAALSILAEMGERMRHTNELMSRQVSKNVLEEAEEKLTLGQRVADKVASFGGSWSFIFAFGAVMAFWMSVNAIDKIAWDIYPYILLNLCLSTIAALQAPVIMMSQNRQAAKDKLLAQNDFQVNLKNELGIEAILRSQQEILHRLNMLERVQGKQTS